MRSLQTIQKWIEVKSRKHRLKEIVPANSSGATNDDQDVVSGLLYQNEYSSKISKKKRKRTKEIDDELADALATISTGESTQSHGLPNDHQSNGITKKKSKSERKRLKLMAVGAAEEIPAENLVVVPETGKTSRKRILEIQKADEDDSAVEVKLSKKSKKSKKQYIDNPSEFQTEHFLKSPVVVETISRKSIKKSMKKMNRLAKELDATMQL